MSRRPRLLVWDPPGASEGRRSLREYLLLYAVLAVIVVVFGLVTGGSFVRTLLIAVGVLVVATAWTGWRLRREPPREGE